MNIRCLGGVTNHHVDIVRHDGNCVQLFNGAAWVPIVFQSMQSHFGSGVDVFDCMIDGVPHSSVQVDADYFIFAYLSAGTVGIDLSRTTNGMGPDVTSGYLVKAGDPTRLLIGGLQYQSGGVGLGAPGAQNNNVGSYFNPLTLNPTARVQGGIPTASTPDSQWTRVQGSRISLWCWGDAKEPFVEASGSFTGHGTVYAGISVDSHLPYRKVCWTPSAVGQTVPFYVPEPNNAITTGLHVFDLMLRAEAPGQQAWINPEASLTSGYLG